MVFGTQWTLAGLGHDIAAKLIASLDGEPEEDVEAAWATEAERRVGEVETGRARLVPWDEIERRIAPDMLKR